MTQLMDEYSTIILFLTGILPYPKCECLMLRTGFCWKEGIVIFGHSSAVIVLNPGHQQSYQGLIWGFGSQSLQRVVWKIHSWQGQWLLKIHPWGKRNNQRRNTVFLICHPSFPHSPFLPHRMTLNEGLFGIMTNAYLRNIKRNLLKKVAVFL